MLESAIEQSCVKALKKKGFLSIKLTSLKGLPDRMFISPRGDIFFVEFKKPDTGTLSPHQKYWMKELIDRNCVWFMTDNRKFFLDWVTHFYG